MSADLSRTPLHDWHASHGGRMVDFAGWSMPVQYTSIVAEHRATRQGVGLFDISHMGRLEVSGSGSEAWLDHLLTRRVAGLKLGQVRYSLVTNAGGGIMDDVLVYHLSRPSGERFYLLVVNASNRLKILSWLQKHLEGRGDVDCADRTLETAMVAIQGPAAVALVDPLLSVSLSEMRYYRGAHAELCGVDGIVSRTGYTGEDGCELILSAEAARGVWERVLADGQAKGARAAGLGARDTLRLEAAMPLYGQELSEDINPFQAGLGFAVQLRDRDFVGREALQRLEADPDQLQRVGLQLQGRRVPRTHCRVLAGGETVGEVTSGTFAPTLERPIAMAYVRQELTRIGTEVVVDIRGQHVSGQVVELPFYRRPN